MAYDHDRTHNRRTRVERHHEKVQARKREFRRNAIIALVALVALAAVIVGGYFLVRGLKGGGGEEQEPVTYKVVVPEGFTVRQIGLRLENATDGMITREEFEAEIDKGDYDYEFLEDANGNLEGFLFPKTYELTSENNARDFIDMLLNQFSVETENLDWSKAEQLGVTPYQVLIIASMIEKEVVVPEERPIVASVIYNRLKNNMRLQIDPTVRYALDDWETPDKELDLQVDSPYNTYRVYGLPPAPICNPGFESISSALNPQDTIYLYFFSPPGQDNHLFTDNYDEFIRWQTEYGI